METNAEVTAIDRAAKTVSIKTESGVRQERYDKLVLSMGANALRPLLPGIDLPGIFSLRTIPDSRLIRDWIDQHDVKTAVVVGGGFIGIEMAENLIERGLKVTLIEGNPQILPPMDPEMTTAMADVLVEHGCKLVLGERVSGFTETTEDGQRAVNVHTSAGRQYPGQLVILGIGVTPNSQIAKAAGIETGPRGGIRVKDNMQTLTDPDIFAVGDVIEVTDWVTQEQEQLPLAGPANRQGRIAADAITGHPEARFRGVQGTAVCGAFGKVAAVTGAAEKTLRRLNRPYSKVYLHPGHHVGYYPGAQPIALKVIFDPETGLILGGQAAGGEGTEKRIDVISTAIQGRMTMFDLEEAELCYAPQFGAAKDPVNMAGFIAGNALRGDAPLESWQEVLGPQLGAFQPGNGSGVLLDVREPSEFSAGHVEGALNIPLPTLRARMAELPKDVPIHVTCMVGQRGYYGTRVLRLNGYDARNITGGMKTFWAMEKALRSGAQLS